MRDYNIRTAAAVVLYDTSKYSLYVLQCRASRSRCSIPGTWYGTCKHPTDYANQRYTGVCLARKKLIVSRDYLITRTCYKQSNAFLMRRRRRSAVFPMERGPTAKHHPAWHPQCTQWCRAEERKLLCPSPKVTPRSSLGDVGEARWPLSHRWTDTSSTLPDVAHDRRNQGRVVSLSELSLLSSCVRLCQLREVHHSLQQSLNPWSRTQSAATDGSPACCTSSLMLRVCVMLRVLPSQSSVRSLLVLLLHKQRC